MLFSILSQVVLVHNFFTGGGPAARWRLLYGWMAEAGLLQDGEKGEARFACPKFNPRVGVHWRGAALHMSCMRHGWNRCKQPSADPKLLSDND